MRLVPVTISASGIFASVPSIFAPSVKKEARQYYCAKLQTEVKDALANNAQSASYEAAVQEKTYGLQFCANGLYKNGVEHYAEALRLLGVSQG